MCVIRVFSCVFLLSPDVTLWEALDVLEKSIGQQISFESSLTRCQGRAYSRGLNENRGLINRLAHIREGLYGLFPVEPGLACITQMLLILDFVKKK